MGCTNTKVEYTCECGENYGICDKKAVFIMEYNRTVDIATLYYKHGDNPASILGYFDDDALDALSKLLLGDSELIDHREFINIKEQIKQCQNPTSK